MYIEAWSTMPIFRATIWLDNIYIQCHLQFKLSMEAADRNSLNYAQRLKAYYP